MTSRPEQGPLGDAPLQPIDEGGYRIRRTVGTGGNITTTGSASDAVTTQDISEACRRLSLGPGDLVCALPEVPLPSRIRLLAHGARNGATTAASMLPAEAAEFIRVGGMSSTQYLFLNVDEAAALVRACSEKAPGATEEVVSQAARVVEQESKDTVLFVTDGPRGAWAARGSAVEHTAPVPVEAAATGGAGDAFMAGVLSGISCGLPIFVGTAGGNRPQRGARRFAGAVDLGVAVAAASVTSPHTIHPDLDARLVSDLIYGFSSGVTPAFRRMFGMV